MTSTNINVGVNQKSASRILKPPGGGHSNIFAPPEVRAHPPRPKYDQQNSSNLNGVMGTVDPNILVQQATTDAKPSDNRPENNSSNNHEAAFGFEPKNENNVSCPNSGSAAPGGRGRVPPGGFSSGLW